MGEKSGNGNGVCRPFGAIFNLPRQSVFDLDEEIEAQKKYQGGVSPILVSRWREVYSF